VQGEGFLERGGEGDVAVFAAFAVGDANAAGVQVDLADPDRDELGDADPGVEQDLDQHDVPAPPRGPHRLVIAADLGLGGRMGQLGRAGGDLDAKLVAQVAEHLFEVGVVGAFSAEVLRELAGLTFGRSPAEGWSGRSGAGHDVRSRRRSGRSRTIP
jgi:hypothetical protein